MRFLLTSLFIIGSSLSATTPVLPMPDLLVYGLVSHDPDLTLPQTAEWTLTYDSQVLTDLPVEFFAVAGLTYYVASVPSVYTVSGTVPAGHLQVGEQPLQLSITFQGVDSVALSLGDVQTSFDYGLSELGLVYELNLIEPGYSEWLDDLYVELPAVTLLDPNLDSDDDSFSNQDEFLAGTDPYQGDIFPGMTNRDWWIKRGVIDTSVAPKNLSLVALGQLKHMAYQGLEEVREKYPQIAPLIEADLQLVFDLNGGNSPSNMTTANLGQLKAVSYPFFKHLNLNKPWAADQLPSNYELAALGQLKHIFDFPIQSQADHLLDYGARSDDLSLVIDSYSLTPYTGQDSYAIGSDGVVLHADGSIQVEGNAWKVLELPNGPNAYVETPQDIELNTSHVLSFEFKKSGPTAEIYAIGLYNPDASPAKSALVAFGGTQTVQSLPLYGDQSIADEDWRKVVIPIGEFAEAAGTLSQLNGQLMLVLINDADAAGLSEADSHYRNIRLIDYTK